MRVSRGWIAGVLVVISLTAGCGGGGDDTPEEVTASFGTEFAGVTDTAAGALTDEQVDQIRTQCKDGAGVPGSNDDCLNSLPNFLPACRSDSEWCVYGGVIGGTNSGVIRVVEQGSEAKACSDPVCSGITVPTEVVEVLVESSTSITTPTTTLSPTVTTPTPTDQTTGPTDATTTLPTDTPTGTDPSSTS